MSDFFQNIVGKVESVLGGDVQTIVKQQLQSLTQPQTLQSLLDRADQAGLGDKVRSWISQSGNVPATPDEIRSILGSSAVHDLVEKTGLPADAVVTALVHFLPDAVDQHTPNGVLPTTDSTKSA
ncbi:MAG: YidB family protein [Acetobacter sp.]